MDAMGNGWSLYWSTVQPEVAKSLAYAQTIVLAMVGVMLAPPYALDNKSPANCIPYWPTLGLPIPTFSSDTRLVDSLYGGIEVSILLKLLV